MRPRRLLRIWLGGLGVAVTAAAGAAQDPGPAGYVRVGPAVPCPCPTPLPVVPGQPAPAPGTVPTTPTPDTSPLTAPPAAEGTGLGEGPAAGTASTASIAPNMMGDLFGARSIRIGYSRLLSVTFPNAPLVGNGVQVIPNTGQITLVPLPGQSGSPFSAGPFQQLGQISPVVQPLLPGQTTITPAQALAAQSLLQAVVSSRGLNPAQVQFLPPNLQAQLPLVAGALNPVITQATHGLSVPTLTVGPVTGQVQGQNLVYSAVLTGEQVVPLPGASSVVGRVKMSEENNPLPRDRFIFVYDYFNNVPFTQDGINVNRFQFGFEKTFLDGRASFEVRLPFAGTLNSTTIQGLESTGTELGNLRLALKYLWAQSQYAAFSTGTAVTLPTADSVTVLSADPNAGLLYRYTNRSVQVEPFAALLLTPTDRLFGQVWSSVNFDTSGGQLNWNPAVFGGTGSAHVWDLPVLAVDSQIGYWLVRNDFGTLRGLAPFLELHWNRIIAQSQLVREVNRRTGGQGLTVSDIGGAELNLTAGLTSRWANNLLVTVGASAPLLPQPDRTFNAQFGVRVNWLFGPTARQRNPAYFANTF